MQNRYFGDVGDFGKYGLLRKLCNGTGASPQLSLSMIWYLVPDEGHNGDGKHISYLQKPEFSECDLELLETLKDMLKNNDRAVDLIQKSNLLHKDTVYFDDYLTFNSMPITGKAARDARHQHRVDWVERALKASAKSDVVFLDPDNGFEIKSVKKHTDKGPKYVFWDEFQKFQSRDQTIVVYHHLNRTLKSRDQISIKLDQFKDIIGANKVIPVLFKRGSHRVFFVIPSNKHKSIIEERLGSYEKSLWAPHIEIF